MIENKVFNYSEEIKNFILESSSYSRIDIANIINVDEKVAQKTTIDDVIQYYRNEGILKF